MLSGELVSLILASIAGIVWLVRLEGRVNDAHRRCDDLKSAIKGLEEMPERMARIETRLDGVLEAFRDLNASIRWMRQPAPDYQFNIPRRPTE